MIPVSPLSRDRLEQLKKFGLTDAEAERATSVSFMVLVQGWHDELPLEVRILKLGLACLKVDAGAR